MQDLKQRTRLIALQIIRLYSQLPKKTETQIIGKQLLRSGTSVGAHYAEASRGRSNAEFISKIEGGLQELEESIYWMDLLITGDLLNGMDIGQILAEAKELSAIFTKCSKNAKQHKS